MLSGLISYLDSIKARDPAPRSRWEVLLYPGVLALGLHRIAHWLFKGELYFLARAINHLSRFLTAIDQIGRASCRERVCQYVSISVVPVPLKKKHQTMKYQNTQKRAEHKDRQKK